MLRLPVAEFRPTRAQRRCLARNRDVEIMQEMVHYFSRLWMGRLNAEPTPDLISMMIHSDAMSQMSPQEFMGNLVLLIVGGNDTTRNTMSGIIQALDQFPDQRALFETDPSVIPNAVQECIRYVTPLAHMRRTATEDCDLFGQQIKAGDKLILWYLSANRDEEVFDNPDKLDLTRENARRHLSFGYGIHRCVGARHCALRPHRGEHCRLAAASGCCPDEGRSAIGDLIQQKTSRWSGAFRAGGRALLSKTTMADLRAAVEGGRLAAFRRGFLDRRRPAAPPVA